jgi:hypothetical protein
MRHPQVTFGYGGELAANYDEMNAISYDLLIPSLVALILVLVLLHSPLRKSAWCYSPSSPYYRNCV